MASKIHPSTAAQPECCAKPVHTINETAGTCFCHACKTSFRFDGAAWVKAEKKK